MQDEAENEAVDTEQAILGLLETIIANQEDLPEMLATRDQRVENLARQIEPLVKEWSDEIKRQKQSSRTIEEHTRDAGATIARERYSEWYKKPRTAFVGGIVGAAALAGLVVGGVVTVDLFRGWLETPYCPQGLLARAKDGSKWCDLN